MNEILKNIKERRSSRGEFDNERPISSQELRMILEAASWAPTPHNMQNFQVIALDDKETLAEIGKIKRQISEDFIRENYQQLSFSEEELKAKKTGILSTSFPQFMRKPTIEKNEQIRNPVQTSPVMLVVVYDTTNRAPASEGDFLGVMGLGCVMENMWLIANSLGLGFHLMSALNGEPAEGEAKKILGIPEQFRIAYTIRLGYPLKSDGRLRVRRDIEDFTHHNEFGVKGDVL